MGKRLPAALLFVALAGCGKSQVPTERYFGGQPVSHWLEALRSPDPKVRNQAADVLGNVGPSDPRAVPALADAVKDEDAKVRDAAVLALSKLGPAAETASPALEGAAHDEDGTVRAHAAIALG